jgi:hypothetical protein
LFSTRLGVVHSTHRHRNRLPLNSNGHLIDHPFKKYDADHQEVKLPSFTKCFAQNVKQTARDKKLGSLSIQFVIRTLLITARSNKFVWFEVAESLNAIKNVSLMNHPNAYKTILN